ncbi:MAG: hypothetical protein WDM86_20410 [Rhizomicrobium sp.]
MRIPAVHREDRWAVRRAGGKADETAEGKFERDALELRRWRLAPLQLDGRAEAVECGTQALALFLDREP